MKKLKKRNYIGKIQILVYSHSLIFSFVLYLKQFPVHENKSTEELLASIECCPKGWLTFKILHPKPSLFFFIQNLYDDRKILVKVNYPKHTKHISLLFLGKYSS